MGRIRGEAEPLTSNILRPIGHICSHRPKYKWGHHQENRWRTADSESMIRISIRRIMAVGTLDRLIQMGDD